MQTKSLMGDLVHYLSCNSLPRTCTKEQELMLWLTFEEAKKDASELACFEDMASTGSGEMISTGLKP